MRELSSFISPNQTLKQLAAFVDLVLIFMQINPAFGCNLSNFKQG